MPATSRLETELPFRCARCGFEGVAAVVGEGSSEDRPGEAGLDAAEGHAWEDALSSVALAPCPACARSDAAAWRAWLMRCAAVSLAWGLSVGVLGGLGLFLLRQEVDGWPLVAAGGSGSIALATRLVVVVRRKRSRAASVAIRPTGARP